MINAEISFRATPNAVHKLQKISQRIAENDGNIVAEEIWREEDAESELALEQASKISNNRDVSISVGNSRLSRLEDLLGAIESLKSSLERRISHFRQHKPSRTITDLPDELLVLILDMAGGAKPTLSELSWLSLVCRRFRRITISIPSLWARKEILSSMPQHVIDLIVGRSRRLGLCLKINSLPDTNNAIFKLCDRWSKITLDVLSPVDSYIFQRFAPSTNLTSLRELCLIGSPEDYEHQYYFFDDDWRPAALKSLDCFCALPVDGSTAWNLTSFSFKCNGFDIADLILFLSKTPLLENLCIVFDGTVESGLDEDELVCLPLLKNFSFNSCGAEQNAAEDVFRAISFPNITTLDIGIKALLHDNARDIITSSCLWAAVEGMEYRTPHLEQLNLVLVRGEFETEQYNDPHSIEEIFSNLPKSIQSFSLTVCNDVLRARDFNDSFGKLQSVRFNDCNRLDANFFEDLVDLFKDANILLDVLEVHHCRSLFSEEDIQEEMVKVLFRDAGVLRT